jgi:hypothetical protein
MEARADQGSNPALTGGGEPIDLDHYIQRRAVVVDTWTAWDEQPGNSARANAFIDACIDYAGESHVAFSKFIGAVRRGGGDRVSALHAWEADW